jgi:hypothetical protein
MVEVMRSVWGVFVDALGILAILSPIPIMSFQEKVVVGLSLFALTLMIFHIFHVSRLQNKIRPIKVKSTVSLTPEDINLIFLLEKSQDLMIGDLLMLECYENNIQKALALLEIEQLNTKEYPQAVISDLYPVDIDRIKKIKPKNLLVVRQLSKFKLESQDD